MEITCKCGAKLELECGFKRCVCGELYNVTSGSVRWGKWLEPLYQQQKKADRDA